MLIIGLTGGIASGKSTISQMIKDKRYPVIDADLIARQVVMPGSPILNKLKDTFGSEIVLSNGQLDRKGLAAIVFNSKNEDALNKLNAIMLPAIREEIEKQINFYRVQGNKYCFVDAAILIESKFIDLVDYAIVVFLDPKIQLQRLMNRDHCTEGEALNKINAQMPFEEKRKYADFILDNSRDAEYTNQQLNKLLEDIAIWEGIND